MPKKLLRILLISLSMATITACGMKGPLEHPKLAQIDHPATDLANLSKINSI